MIAIFKREIKALFTGVVGWLFMAAILFLYGLYFYVYNIQNAYPYVSYSLSGIAFLILIMVPVLTMRSLSEERRTKTDQLILTAPVSIGKIVFGKFLAMAAVYTVDMIVISITPLVLSLYGTVPFGESYSAICGFWLYGLACIAIGEMISSVTESQIIAAVLSFIVLFLGYMMNGICGIISEGGNIITRILGCYDLYSHMGPFMAGTFDLRAVVYYISLITLVLFLTTQIIEKRRWTISVSRIGRGVFSVTSIITAVVICVLINLGMTKIPSEYTSLDVTYNKMFELSEQTKEYIKSLDEDISMYVWVAENSADTTLKETLDRYNDLSKHIKVSYVNPTDNPDFFKQFAEVAPAQNSIIVASGKRSRIISYDDIYVKSYDYYNYTSSIDGYDAEGQIDSAIEYVTTDSTNMPYVYVLNGHDEVTIGSVYTQALTKSNINMEQLTLLTSEAVPENCSLLIINGAQSDLSKEDLEKIRTYLSEGGTVLVTTSFDSGAQTNMDALLGDYGIVKEPGVVMDNDGQRAYAQTPYYLLPELGDNSYTSGVTGGYVFAPYASGLRIEDYNEKYDYTVIMNTSDKAVSKTNTEEATTSDYEDGDIKGPFIIGCAAMKADGPGTLIVIGSIDVFTDDANSIVAGGNAGLFKSIVDYHIGEAQSHMPVIDSKSYTVDNLVITSATGIIVGFVVMLIIPLVLVSMGILIWVMRRKL